LEAKEWGFPYIGFINPWYMRIFFKKGFLFLLCFSGVFGLHAGAQLPANKTFYPNGAGVVLTVPGGKMIEKTHEINTPVGNLMLNEFALDLTAQGQYFAFLFSYVDYPPGSMHQDSMDLLKDFFQIAKDESIFLMKGALMYESYGSWYGYPSYQWRINYKKDQYSIRNLSILAGSRYYLLRVVSSADIASGEIAQDFINSLRLIE
jgi:hypothetical protein